MTELGACRHDGPRVPIEIPLLCDCTGGDIGTAPGTMCALCEFNFRKDPGWGPAGAKEDAFRERHFSSGEHARRIAEDRRFKAVEPGPTARESAERKPAAELEGKRRAEAAERERKEKALVERAEAERRRTEIDTALVAGKNPDLIPYSVRGATVAQVRARQVELARLKENRGQPWAELALDREVLRLIQAGVDRPTVVKRLGVGAHRVARVRRDAGLKSRRFKRTISEPEPEQISRSLPGPDVRSEPPPSEDDRPRRPAPE